ncbi:MAG: hypothetical protein ACU84Q_06585 [Gammaproteobacteria bacterium]
MSQFEFFMVIASILVAIAVTEVVSWWGKLLRNKRIRDVGIINLAWSGLLVSNIVLYWSGFWAYKDLTIVTYPQIWMLLLPTLLAILVAFAITPSSIELEKGFAEYYKENRRLIFFFWALFIFAALAADVVILKSVTFEALMYVAILAVAFVSCALSNDTRVHFVGIMIVFLLVLLLPLALGFGETLKFFFGA